MVPWNILLTGVAAIALAASVLESSSTTAFVLAFATVKIERGKKIRNGR